MIPLPAGITLSLIVAIGRNGVIGADGAMPWRLPSDLARFRRLTLGKPIIMGRKTLQSIGRLLDGRDTIVMTRDPAFAFAGASVAHSTAEALAIAGEAAVRRAVDEVLVLGGGEVYRAFLPLASRLHVTFVDAEPAGDTSFPAIDPAVFDLVEESRPVRDSRDSAAVRFALFERKCVDHGR